MCFQLTTRQLQIKGSGRNPNPSHFWHKYLQTKLVLLSEHSILQWSIESKRKLIKTHCSNITGKHQKQLLKNKSIKVWLHAIKRDVLMLSPFSQRWPLTSQEFKMCLQSQRITVQHFEGMATTCLSQLTLQLHFYESLCKKPCKRLLGNSLHRNHILRKNKYLNCIISIIMLAVIYWVGIIRPHDFSA